MNDEARGEGKSGKRSGVSRRRFSEAAKNPDRVQLQVSEELMALLVAHCRHAATELPPGKPGVRWAADFLAALPGACRQRLPDVVATGPKVFEFFVGQGFFAAMPSPRLVPQVLGLVASVSPLLQARSARQWGVWLARVHDAGSPVVAAIQKKTPSYQLAVTTPAPAGPPLRSLQLRTERDRLAVDMAAMAEENERRGAALACVLEERDRLAAALAGAADRERFFSSVAEADGARIASLQAARARQEAELTAVRAERERLVKKIREAERTSADIRRVLGVDASDPRDDAVILAEVDAAYHRLGAEATALHREVSEVFAERDRLRARCAQLESERSIQGDSPALGARTDKAERALARAREDLTAARHATQTAMERLDRRKNLCHSLQKMMEAQEIELAVANAELAQWKKGMTAPMLIWLARERAIQLVQDAQANRPSLDADE